MKRSMRSIKKIIATAMELNMSKTSFCNLRSNEKINRYTRKPILGRMNKIEIKKLLKKSKKRHRIFFLCCFNDLLKQRN